MYNNYGQSPPLTPLVISQKLKSNPSTEKDLFAQSPRANISQFQIKDSYNDLRTEIRQMKIQISEISQRISENNELIHKLQDEFKTKLQKFNLEENNCIEKVKMQLMTFERKLLDDERKERGDMNQIKVKLCETKTELESKLIIIEENVKQLGEGSHKKFLNIQCEVYDNLEKLKYELQQLNNNKLDLHSAEFSKMKKIINTMEYQTYHIDKFGYLLDCHGTYLLDDNGNIVRLNQQQMEHLKMQFKV